MKLSFKEWELLGYKDFKLVVLSATDEILIEMINILDKTVNDYLRYFPNVKYKLARFIIACASLFILGFFVNNDSNHYNILVAITSILILISGISFIKEIPTIFFMYEAKKKLSFVRTHYKDKFFNT